jgi:pimeloyl-ACP methyl ester carboxylesterase
MQTVRGYFELHHNPSINYQLNRLLPGADFAEVEAAGSRITGLESWRATMLELAINAERQSRWLHGSSYYRAAEFYMLPGDPRKAHANARFIELFDAATADLPLERTVVPYAGGALPALRMQAGSTPRDTLVVHGGFDSYMEELALGYLEFAAEGFEVILFEGPGQGQALRRYGLHMHHAWEQPVAAVLDHFGIGACTLMGWSLGGFLAPRAAAFEPRVKRVIVNDVLADFMDCFASTQDGAGVVDAIEQMLAQQRHRELDALAESLMVRDEIVDWVVRHGMSVCGAASPSGFFGWLTTIRTAPIAARVTQDVLLMAASEDHIVPRRQFHQEVAAFVNASSLTARLLTAVDSAQSHCHVGNLALVGRLVRNWLDFQLDLAEERQPSVCRA